MTKRWNFFSVRFVSAILVVLACAFGVLWHYRNRTNGPRILSENVPVTGMQSPAAAEDSLPDADARLFTEAENLIGKSVATLHFKDPMRYAETGRTHPISLVDARRRFTEKDLPGMYALMKSQKGNPDLRFVAQLIGFISDRGNEESIEVLVEYLQRPDEITVAIESADSTRQDVSDRFMGKIRCLEWIGLIGGGKAEDILLRALTGEGAEDAAAAWIGMFNGGDSRAKGRDEALFSLRGRAAMGLVFCGSMEGLDRVHELFSDERRRLLSGGERSYHWYNAISSAMAIRDYISDRGMESWLRLYGEEDNNYIEILAPYLEPYSFVALMNRIPEAAGEYRAE